MVDFCSNFSTCLINSTKSFADSIFNFSFKSSILNTLFSLNKLKIISNI